MTVRFLSFFIRLCKNIHCTHSHANIMIGSKWNMIKRNWKNILNHFPSLLYLSCIIIGYWSLTVLANVEVLRKKILIQSADPLSRQEVIIIFTHIFRPSIRLHFLKQNNFKLKQCSQLARPPWARLWVRPRGSLMTPVLPNSVFSSSYRTRVIIQLELI